MGHMRVSARTSERLRVSLVMIAMNLAYALTAYPAGALSDRLGRRGGRDILRLVDHEQVAAVGDDVATTIGNQPREDPAVDEWDDRIPATGQDEGRRRQRVQPGDAGPSDDRAQLETSGENRARLIGDVSVLLSGMGRTVGGSRPSAHLLTCFSRKPAL